MKTNKLSSICFLLSIIVLSSLSSCKRNQNQNEIKELDSLVIVEEIHFLKNYDVYTFKYKDEVVTDANRELENMEQSIKSIKDEINNKKDSISEEAKNTYDELLSSIDETKEKYIDIIEKLKESTSSDWDNHKTDAANAYNKLLQDIENINEKLKTNIEGAINAESDTNLIDTNDEDTLVQNHVD